MIEIENLHHVSLSVTNIDQAREFYGETLGFREIERPAFDFPGAWYKIGDRQLHLIVHSSSETIRNHEEIETKDGHFAIRVKNYYQTLEHLKNKNVKILEKLTSKSGFIQVFCADPDGNLIEFNVEQENM